MPLSERGVFWIDSVTIELVGSKSRKFRMRTPITREEFYRITDPVRHDEAKLIQVLEARAAAEVTFDSPSKQPRPCESFGYDND